MHQTSTQIIKDLSATEGLFEALKLLCTKGNHTLFISQCCRCSQVAHDVFHQLQEFEVAILFQVETLSPSIART